MTYEERGKELCRECSMNKICPYIPRKVEYKCQHLSDMMYGWELGRRDTINKIIMATIKSYTSIEQSKKLAEILPIESADMCYLSKDNRGIEFFEEAVVSDGTREDNDIPCWSLAALLGVLPNSQGRYTKSLYWFDNAWHCEYVDEDGESVFGTTADNSLDACYEMIIKLHEQKLL